MRDFRKMRNRVVRFAGVGTLLFGVLVTFAIYWPGLQGGFFFDDYPNIVRNPGVKLDSLSWGSFRLVWLSGVSGQFGRPLSQLSFALNHYFNGFSPFAFKLTNLVIHCLNGLLIYLLGYRLLDSLRQRLDLKNVSLWAALVAFAWMIHPIQLTSVLYVVQRMTSLSAFFLLISLIFHISARRRKDFDRVAFSWLILAWCVFWPLSILSKESGILLPGFVAAYELIIRRGEQRILDIPGRVILILSVLLLVGIVPYLVSPFGQWIISGYKIRSFSLVERLLTEARIIWAYLYWITFPRLEAFALFHDDIALSTGLIAPWITLPAVLGLIGLSVLAVFASWRFPLPAFGIAWFLIGHGLESTFIPLELVHEHRNYLSLFGLVLAVSYLGVLVAKPGVGKTIVITLFGALITYFGVVTFMRVDMFANEEMRTQLEAQFHPDSARANYEAGRTLASVADRDSGNMIAPILAKKHFDMATALDLDYKMGLLGTLVLTCGVSQIIDQAAFEELQRRFREGLILQEDTSILSAFVEMSGAGLSCLKRPEIDALFASYVANPRVTADKKVSMYSLHADYLWLSENDLPATRIALQRALNIAPYNPSLRLKLAQLDYIAGDFGSAKGLLLELRGTNFSPKEREILKSLLRNLEQSEN